MVHYIPTVNIDYSNLKSNWLLLNLSPLHPCDLPLLPENQDQKNNFALPEQ